MSEYDYLMWLSYESSERILFLEGATTVGSEVFQAPICVTQAIRNLRSVETPLEFGSVTVDGQNLQSWNLGSTGFELGQ